MSQSKTHGEGRAGGEKGGRLIETPEAARKRRNARRREDEEWAARSGPVVTIKPEWRDGRLVHPEVPGICVHLVGTTPGLWCGACREGAGDQA